MMCTGLQRYESRRAARLVAGLPQRVDLGVCSACTLVPAFTNNLVVFNQHAADHRVRLCGVTASLGELQRTRHMRVVGCCEVGHDQLSLSFLPSKSGSKDICSRLAAASEIFCRRLISSSNSVTSWKRLYTDAKRT